MYKTYKDILVIGEKLECPICGKEFKVTEDTNSIIGGGYTCSWKCFLDETKRRLEENPPPQKQSEDKTPKRTRVVKKRRKRVRDYR